MNVCLEDHIEAFTLLLSLNVKILLAFDIFLFVFGNKYKKDARRQQMMTKRRFCSNFFSVLT